MTVPAISNRIERGLIRSAVWLLLPLLCGLVCWWTAAAIHIYGLLPLPAETVKNFAFGGLAAGLLACLIFGRAMLVNFYSARKPVVLAVYCCFTFLAFALTMGVPVLVPLPGIALGLYSGRKLAYAKAGVADVKQQAGTIALLAAGVTGLMCSGSILLASLDKSLAGNIGGMLSVDWTREAILAGAVLLLPVIISVQYLLTRWAMRLACHRVN